MTKSWNKNHSLKSIEKPSWDLDERVMGEKRAFLDMRIHLVQYIEYNYPKRVHYHKFC